MWKATHCLIFAVLHGLAIDSRFTLTNYTRYVTVGSRFSFSCEAVNINILNFNILFNHNNTDEVKDILSTDHTRKFTLHSMFDYVNPKYFQTESLTVNNIKSIFVISKPASPHFTGRYTCQAGADVNHDGQIDLLYEDTKRITVGNPPNFVNIYSKVLWKPKKTVFSKNDVINIVCATEMDGPDANFSFSLDGRHDKEVVRSRIGTNYKVMKSLHLTIPEKYDKAEVKCIASNHYGKSENRTFLNVEYKPTTELIEVNGVKEYTLIISPGKTLNCTAKGNPQPQVKWLSPNPVYFKILKSFENVLQSKSNSKNVTTRVTCQATQSSTKTQVQKVFLIVIKHENLAPKGNNTSSCKILFTITLIIIILVLLLSIIFSANYFIYKTKRAKQPAYTNIGINTISKKFDYRRAQTNHGNY